MTGALAALLILTCPACGGCGDPSRSTVRPCRSGPAFLVHAPDGSYAHAVAIGPREAVTTSHLAPAGTVVTVCDGGAAVLVSVDPADYRAARLDGTFADWLETAPLERGRAEILTTSGAHAVEIVDAGAAWAGLTATFDGFQAGPGDSGAAVVQNGRVVGVVQGWFEDRPGRGAVSPVE